MSNRSVLLYFIYLLFLPAFFLAQNKKADSLILVLKTKKEDTARISILNLLGRHLGSAQALKAIEYSTEALQLSEKLNYVPGLAHSHLVLGSLNNLAFNREKALFHLEKSRDLYKGLLAKYPDNTLFKTNLGKAYNNIGGFYFRQDFFDKALTNYSLSISYFDEVANLTDLLRSIQSIGEVYNFKGYLGKATEYYFKALTLAEKNKMQEQINDCQMKIGVVYFEQGEYKTATDYLFKALKGAEKINDLNTIANTYANLGMIEFYREDWVKSKEYSLLALKNYESINDKKGVALSLVNIGAACEYTKDDVGVIYYTKKALETMILINDQRGIATCYINIGAALQRSKKFNEGEKYLLRAIDMVDTIGSLQMKLEFEKLVSNFYEEKGEPAKALIHFKKFVAAKDSLDKKDNYKQITEAKSRFEYQKKSLADSLRSSEQYKLKEVKHQQDIARQRILTTGGAIGFILMIIVAAVSFRAYRLKQKSNVIINQQKAIVEEKQKEIVDSINYAKRIQYALLASDNLLKLHLPDFFVLFKPKDVVSGDFYWGTPTAEGFVMITADCTGHGVPGAFMSLLNISKLNETISEKRILQPDLILNNVRTEIIKALNPPGSIEESKDGMDCVVCKFDLKKMLLQYSAANNSFLIVRNNELIVCKADKMPVGKSPNEEKPFTFNEIVLQKGDTIYCFTDGYADQFGGVNGKKFKQKKLHSALVEISSLAMSIQKDKLENIIESWKGSLDQVDDICVVGIRV